MATESLATSETAEMKYHLPDELRRELVQRSGASISPKKMAIVEQQRQRFIERFGSDGLSDGAEPNNDQ